MLGRSVSVFVASLALACAPVTTRTGDAGSGASVDGGPTGSDGGASSPDGGPPTVDGAAPRPLGLTLEVADGACADLSVTDRSGPAVRFSVTGPAGATVALWADKPACDVEPFVYQEIALDAAGRGAFALSHSGASACDDNLLGGWRVWLALGDETTARQDLAFASGACSEVADCAAAATFCPPEAPTGPAIARDDLFVLSPSERAVFDPPPSWPVEWGTNFEDYPLRNLYEAFDEGRAVVPLDPDAGPAGWYELDGRGSQNHSLLWIGVAALGYALADDVAQYENAATKARRLLELDAMQGHMRHEAIGQYAGFWQGGIATMALAGLYAPDGSTSGPALLADARRWWADHVAALRALRMPDGQVLLVGARLPGETGDRESWMSLSAALSLQLVDPIPHGDLHPTIAALVTAAGEPGPGTGGVPVVWHRPRHVSERWCVLRAVQSGALPRVAADHPPPATALEVFRWEAGGRTHVATPAPYGYRPARWHASWAPGEVLRIELGETSQPPMTGKGPHPAPAPLGIPTGAAPVLAP